MEIKQQSMVLWVETIGWWRSVDLHNMCERNCQHCYMRRSNKDTKRFMCFPVNCFSPFMIGQTHVYDNMEWLYNNGIGSIVIASGEFNNEGRTEFIEGICQNTIDKSKIIDRDLRVRNQIVHLIYLGKGG